jgi:hypothetical protein
MPDLIRNTSWPEIRAVLQDPTIQVGLFGPPGVGKTFSLFEMADAAVRRTKHHRRRAVATARYVGKVQFHSEMSPAEVMGMHVPDGDAFRWESGPADLAYSQGGLLILDEIDQASGPMKTYLMGLLDRGPGGTISYVGRVFAQDPGYQAVATMNDWPDQGALPEALLDRFDAWFLVTRPSEEQLLVLDADLRDICEDAYETAVDPIKGPDITFRLLVGLQKMRRYLPIEQAVLGACYNNKVLAGSLLEVLALTDPDEQMDGVSAASLSDEDDESDDLCTTCGCVITNADEYEGQCALCASTFSEEDDA